MDPRFDIAYATIDATLLHKANSKAFPLLQDVPKLVYYHLDFSNTPDHKQDVELLAPPELTNVLYKQELEFLRLHSRIDGLSTRGRGRFE